MRSPLDHDEIVVTRRRISDIVTRTEKEDAMPHYRFDFSYTSDSWGKLMHTPADRTEAIRPVVEKLGGRFIALYYTMGATDGFVLAELADDATAMAFALSAIAPGHVKGVNTTRLYSPQEMMEGLRRAQSVTLPTPK